MSLHRATVHPEPVDGCFGCKVSTLQFATPPTGEAAGREHTFQARFAAEFHNGDREAYRRLRADGLQPPRIAGSAHLERHAGTRFEVESGRVARDGRALSAALAVAADGGFDPVVPAITPKEG